jgi:hypothetical protein
MEPGSCSSLVLLPTALPRGRYSSDFLSTSSNIGTFFRVRSRELRGRLYDDQSGTVYSRLVDLESVSKVVLREAMTQEAEELECIHSEVRQPSCSHPLGC